MGVEVAVVDGLYCCDGLDVHFHGRYKSTPEYLELNEETRTSSSMQW